MLRKLIGVEGCPTPAGIAGQVRPRRRAEKAHRQPRGKRASCSGNQLLISFSKITTNLAKRA
ncbi:hypothetical protein FZC88_22390 [Rossellomorea aquimaris]|nr:hypothetical protein FZC88_22390 [Rossellomorea aquimaris]